MEWITTFHFYLFILFIYFTFYTLSIQTLCCPCTLRPYISLTKCTLWYRPQHVTYCHTDLFVLRLWWKHGKTEFDKTTTTKNYCFPFFDHRHLLHLCPVLSPWSSTPCNLTRYTKITRFYTNRLCWCFDLLFVKSVKFVYRICDIWQAIIGWPRCHKAIMLLTPSIY